MAVGVFACGGQPPARPVEAAGGDGVTYGWLPMAAADATVWPRDVEAATRWFDGDLQRLVAPSPSLAEAFARAWQSFSDVVAEPAVPGPAGRTLAGRWGLAPDAPVRFMVGAVDGGAAGRALLRALDVFRDAAAGEGDATVLQQRLNDALRGAPVATAHVRGLLRTVAPERTTEALRVHAERFGYEVYELGAPPPAFARGVLLPRDAILVGRHRSTGHLLLLRGQLDARVVDWVVAASPRSPLTGLLDLALHRGASPPPAPAASALGIEFAALALLELALSTGDALRRLEAVDRAVEAPLDVLVAASDLAVACAERWRLLALVAPRVALDWSAGSVPRITVRQSAAAVRATHRATGPAPIDQELWAGLPLSTAARWHRATFLEAMPEAERLPAEPLGLWEDAAACRGGHPLARVAALAAALPALDAGSWATAFVPGEVSLLGRSPWFIALGILGLSETRPPTPRVGLVSLAAVEDLPVASSSLAPDAEVTIGPRGPTYVQGAGETRLAYGRRSMGEGRELALLGFGHDALERLETFVGASTTAAPLARVSFDAAGLSAATGFADDPEVRAVLAAWAHRALRLDVRVDGTDTGLVYAIDFRANLDPERSPR
jgi:hypothetical protein